MSFRIVTTAIAVMLAARGFAAPQESPRASAAAATSTASAKPATRDADPGVSAFDRIMAGALKTRNIPGGALAIVKDGRLVVAQGYGLANVKTQEPVTLDTLFSTASITKTITAAAVLRLADQKKLSLDDPVYALLGKPRPLGAARVDPLAEKITVRHLLLHAAGWNSKLHGDPLFQTRKIARLAGERFPLSAETVTRYGLSRPLDFAPGSESHYSSFCYFLAAQVVRQAARQPYESYVRQEVLRPLGIGDMRLEQLAPAYAAHEAHRYRGDGRELPGGRAAIAAPAGCWLANVVDLARFAGGLCGPCGKPLLGAEARQQMFAVPPRPLDKRRSGEHLGLGWDAVGEGANGLEYRKSGSAAGVRTYIAHVAPDIDWVLLLNSDGTPDGQSSAAALLVAEIRRAIDRTRQWPQRDLFEGSAAVARK
jgi:CubicO group peptidase (beta-lactamase class C family)